MSATLASTSRERGPASTSTPYCVVTLSMRTPPSVGAQLLQRVEIVRLERAGGNEVEFLRADLRQREFGAHAAASGQEIGQRDPADRLRESCW